MPTCLPGPTEAEFTDQVIALARLHGWRVAHFRPARTKAGWRTAVAGDGKGFPDLVLLREKRMVVAELKVGNRKPDADQQAWMKAFDDASAEVHLWYPADWQGIVECLDIHEQEFCEFIREDMRNFFNQKGRYKKYRK